MKKFIKQRLNEILQIDEARQSGILYHFTNEKAAISIVDTNSIRLHSEKYGKSMIELRGFSTTRNKRFWAIDRDVSNPATTRLAFDGNKISQNYKIVPYNAYDGSARDHKEMNVESEEKVLVPDNKPFKVSDYLVGVSNDLSAIYMRYYEKELPIDYILDSLKKMTKLKAICVVKNIDYEFISSDKIEEKLNEEGIGEIARLIQELKRI